MCILCGTNKQKENKKEQKWIFFNDVFAQKISDTIAATTSEICFCAVLL
jgi:hypothetical protein